MPRVKSMEVKKSSPVGESIPVNYLHEIEKRAFELFQERMKNSINGDPVMDWFQAEKEIKSKYQM